MRGGTAPGALPVAGQNLVDLLRERAARTPGSPAATHKVAGRWVDVRWDEVLARVRQLSAGLRAGGLVPGERVGLFAATSLQWVVCDLAISAAGALTVPLYASDTPEACRHILAHAGVSLLFVDDDVGDGRQAGRLTRIRQRRGELPALRQVVVFDGRAAQAERGEVALSAVEEAGEAWGAQHPEDFARTVAGVGREQPWGLLYTSGTTGEPKGVLLTHGNWLYQAQALGAVALMEPGDCVLLFLPLAHAFAQGVKVAWLALGFRLAFAESVERLPDALVEVRPTILPAVPRVFEKVYAAVRTQATDAPGLQGWLARWAFSLFDAWGEAQLEGRELASPAFALARRLVFAGRLGPLLRARLGGRLRLAVSGGAPLSPRLALFFALLGLEVLEGYGLTEASAAATLNPPGHPHLGTVGRPLPGTEVRIAPDGEVLLKGPGIMSGYYRDAAATRAVLEPEGWLHTGDVGEVDAAGFLRLTDRKKDLIITAGGKNVAPQALENALKAFPLISQALVYGDRRPYLVALVTVREEAARRLLQARGGRVDGYAALARRPEVRAAVADIIRTVNAELPPHATLKAFALGEADFTQEGGELTPTLKVKRREATRKHQALLDHLYADPHAPEAPGAAG